MIWDIIQQSTFDKYFSNPNLTIQQLLVDENILTEMQNLNPHLLQYITKNEKQIFNKLVHYVTVMPKQQQGYDRCHRLPYVSSEMLAIDNQLIYQAFLSNKQGNQNIQSQHLRKLFQFLNSDAADNQLLLGYFQKVVNNLYKGRKLQFTKSVAKNIQLFANNLDKQAIGNILKNCVILLDTKQGILYQQRKNIVQILINNLVTPKKKQKQTRDICGTVLVQIIGRHKTFSSGDQLLKYILNQNTQLLLIYINIDSSQICKFFIGVLNKSTQKIYNPQLDIKVNIFQIPQKHKLLLQNYIPLKLSHCQKIIQIQHIPQYGNNNNKIKQQDGYFVTKLNKQILQFLTLVAISLQNQIDTFLLPQQNLHILQFIWDCMKKHPKNDIAIVQIVRIFLYIISDRSKNKDKLHQLLINQFKIVQKLTHIFKDERKQKLLRPHLFQIWNKVKQLIPTQIYQLNNQWKELCKVYEELIPLHTKATGLSYQRSALQKIIVDQQDTAGVDNGQNKQRIGNQQGAQAVASWRHQTNQNKFQEDVFSQLPQKSSLSKNSNIQKQQFSKSPSQNKQSLQNSFEKKNKSNSSNFFNQFDYFLGTNSKKSDTEQEKKQQKKQQSADFAAFDSFI